MAWRRSKLIGEIWPSAECLRSSHSIVAKKLSHRALS